jgi:hypothetical protein
MPSGKSVTDGSTPVETPARAARRKARRMDLARGAAFGALALAIFAAEMATKSNKKYGPKPIKAARSLSSDVSGPWKSAVMEVLGIEDYVPHQNADMLVEALVAGASVLGQRKPPSA